MQRYRIIDSRRYSKQIQRLPKLIASKYRNTYCILRPCRNAPREDLWDCGHFSKRRIVLLRNFVATCNLIGKNTQLFNQYGGLNRVKAPIDTNSDIVVFVSYLAVNAQRPYYIGQFGILSKNSTTVAITTQRLRQEKTRCRCNTDGADLSAFVCRTERLGRVG